jgi:hypothetical protein
MRPMQVLNEPVLQITLILVIIICSLGLMNVIIGVIVERTLAVQNENEASVHKILAECEKRVMTSMKKEFIEFAQEHGTKEGELTFDQFCAAIRTKSFQTKLRIIGLPLEDAEELFFLLDVDNSESLSVEEFVEGVHKMKGAAQGSDMIQLLAYVQRGVRHATMLGGVADKLIDQCDTLLEKLDDMWSVTENELFDRGQREHRQQELEGTVKSREHMIVKMNEKSSTRERLLKESLEQKRLHELAVQQGFIDKSGNKIDKRRASKRTAGPTSPGEFSPGGGGSGGVNPGVAAPVYDPRQTFSKDPNDESSDEE